MLTDLQELLHMFPMLDLFGGIRQRGLSPSAASHFNTGVGVFMFCPCSTAATGSFESSLQKKCKLGMCWAGTGGGECVTHKKLCSYLGWDGVCVVVSPGHLICAYLFTAQHP